MSQLLFYYQILPTRNIGQNLSILTYSSTLQLLVGDMVEIELRSSDDFGLVLSILENAPDYDLAKIKVIKKVLPLSLTRPQMQFLDFFVQNTFNSPNDTFGAIFQSCKLLTQSQWHELEIIKNKNTQNIANSTTETYDPNLTSESDQKSSNLPIITNQLDTANISTLELSNEIVDKQNQKTAQNANIEDKKIKLSTKININQKNQTSEIEQGKKPKPEIQFEILQHTDILIRIMDIIRTKTYNLSNTNQSSTRTTNQQFCVVFPEKKYLDLVYSQMVANFEKDENNENWSNKISLCKYTGDNNKFSRQSILEVLGMQNNIKPKKIPKNKNKKSAVGNETLEKVEIQNIDEVVEKNNSDDSKLKIIFCTRAGIFLPFVDLVGVILVDEANSLYIQDQNSLYYDTREAVFLLHKAYECDLNIISTLPSVRLHSFYSKEVLNNLVTSQSLNTQKHRTIKITKQDKKSSNFDLFGWEIEQILRGKDTHDGVVVENDI